ncbi:MAG TPA: sugar ABC transporter permease [Longimicrobiales bacterium]
MTPARRILLATVALPLAAAVFLAAWRLGAARHAIAAAGDVRAAEAALAAYRAAGDASDAMAGAYDVAVYLDGRQLRPGRAAFAPATLPGALVDSLGALDRAFAFHTPDGRCAALAPIKDADDWGLVGAILVASRAPRPAGLPAAPLALGALAWALAMLPAWWGAARRRGADAACGVARPLAPAGAGEAAVRRAGAAGRAPAPSLAGALHVALVYAPVAALAAYLLGPAARSLGEEAGGFRFHVVVIFGAWAALAAVGLSLLRVADSRRRLREAVRGWAFLAPSFAHLLLFSVGPILFSLWLSFHEWNLVEAERPFVGLANYAALLRDAPFWRAVRNTAVYVLFVPAGMLVALALALLVDRKLPGVRLLRTVLFLPYVTSFVAISLVWKWMFEPDFGLLNRALGWFGIAPQPWLSAPETALPSLMLMSIWMYAGYMMVLFLAGLQNIPRSLYESARIDGANAWQRFTRITLPLLRPTTFFVLVTMVIFMFQVFTAIYVMTEGGPLHATDVIVYHIYRNAWEYLRMGYASAMAWVLFGVVFAVTLVQFRFLGRAS